MRKLPPKERHLRAVPDLPRDENDLPESLMEAHTEIILMSQELVLPYERPTNIPPEQHYPVQSSHIRTLCSAVGALIRYRENDPTSCMLNISPRHVRGASDYLSSSRPWVGGSYYETDEDTFVTLSLSVLTGSPRWDRWQSELLFLAPKLRQPGLPDLSKAVRFRNYLDAGTEVSPHPLPEKEMPVTVYQSRAVFSMLRSAVGFGDGTGDYGHKRIPAVPEAELPFVFENLDLELLNEPIFNLPPRAPGASPYRVED